jgi:hypothetical protein
MNQFLSAAVSVRALGFSNLKHQFIMKRTSQVCDYYRTSPEFVATFLSLVHKLRMHGALFEGYLDTKPFFLRVIFQAVPIIEEEMEYLS